MSPRGRNRLEEAIKDPLPGLKKQLAGEYEDQTEERIDEAAKHALGEFAGARLREFVPIFAWRHARELLRRAS